MKRRHGFHLFRQSARTDGDSGGLPLVLLSARTERGPALTWPGPAEELQRFQVEAVHQLVDHAGPARARASAQGHTCAHARAGHKVIRAKLKRLHLCPWTGVGVAMTFTMYKRNMSRESRELRLREAKRLGSLVSRGGGNPIHGDQTFVLIGKIVEVELSEM